MLKVCLGSDHRGVQIKAKLIQTLKENGYATIDAGTDTDAAVDYPDFACKVAEQVGRGQADRGILICGTGIGMAIVANKYPGVRAAPCYDEVMVEMSRRHNDVNVLCLPGDLIGERPVDELVLMWLRTDFEGGRHAKRIEKISALDAVALCVEEDSASSSSGSHSAAAPTSDDGTSADESPALANGSTDGSTRTSENGASSKLSRDH